MTAAPTPAAIRPAMASVLVVDDNNDACRVMAKLLSQCGHEVECVTSGEEALAFLSCRHFDLVILDAMMPGMDGMEVLRRVRSDPILAAVKIVMWTAIGDDRYAEQAKAKGAEGYWPKGSFNYKNLCAMVADVLAAGRAP